MAVARSAADRAGAADARAELSDDLAPAGVPVLGDIPWGYGENRVTAIPVDPYRLFVYWELTDDAIERGRAQIGTPDSGCVLRLCDTTHRLFNGMNANWWMDVPVHRPSNNHYVLVNRPGAVFHVDIGVRAGDETFATIARSGAVEMPRNSIAADSRIEWMTVHHDGTSPAPYIHRFVPRPWTSPSSPHPVPDVEIDRIMQSLAGQGWSRTEEWTETWMGGRVVRWIRWTGPVRHGWGVATTEILFQGGRRIEWTEQGERVVLGPWRLTMYGLTPQGGLDVVSRWEIRWWFEGPMFLDFLFRKMQYDQDVVAPITPSEYLARHPTNQVATPCDSSWGYKGYNEVWLNGSNDWLYRHQHKMGERMVELARRHPDGAQGLRRRALNQAVRELLLAQASDWAFIMKTGTTTPYAVRRACDHINRFNHICESVLGGAIHEPWLRAVEEQDNLFPELDYRVYLR